MKPIRPSKNQLYAASVFGAISGALTLYLVKRPDLRKKLTKADSPADALKAFGEHMQKDSNSFVKSLKEFAEKQMSRRREVKKAVKSAKREVKAAAKRGAKVIKEAAVEAIQ